ncbi:PIN domain-containing protein [Novosphingobium beihaiensis]|uniref:PIN domain-containing protein n=1 Tax=Novosphingobium beihaiensis TaxID=2930389 RepID=A0ABT0BW23_9SPHN|nr:hypothetical protein [Novosphingobium beihaiensis]MCJ2189275.1 hypothetical protein [Novosphingobium beihaiensis]
MNDEESKSSIEDVSGTDPSVVAARLPPLTRMGFECPKPKNWQDFQRACVALFREELKDPHAQEYGRHGQKQRGIDILGRRNGDPDHFVGIQCRRVQKPLAEKKIEEDCRAALTIQAGIREIIFATTAPVDTGATDAAISVEKKLRKEGHNVTVALYGWEALQDLIAMHPNASAVFNPALYASATTQQLVTPELVGAFAAQVGQQLAQNLQTGMSFRPVDPGTDEKAAEDPALHAKIDVLRDLFLKDHQTLSAQRLLTELQEATSAVDRPWAAFRLETNLGSIDMELGREQEAAQRFERAFALRPGDSHAVANLALARTIQGRASEAIPLAQHALTMSPRADSAVAYLLQAAARSDWQGDPESLIPDDLKNSLAAAFGLAEFMRRRDLPGWAERTIELYRQHPSSEELKRANGVAVLELAIRHDAMIIGGTPAVSMVQINAAADDVKEVAERFLDIDYKHDHDLRAFISNAAVLLRIAGREKEAEALLVKALGKVPDEPHLTLLLAVIHLARGQQDAALGLLEGTKDPESRMVRAELLANKDPDRALKEVLAVQVPEENARLTRLRFRLIGEIALAAHKQEEIAIAAAGLRTKVGDPFAAELLETRAKLSELGPEAGHQSTQLNALVSRLSPDTDIVTRYDLAYTLMQAGSPASTVTVLEGYIDLNRHSEPGELYLQALAAARHDAEFDLALANAAPELRDHPNLLWTRAARAWNMGDLEAAYSAINKLTEIQPDNAGAALFKIDILARADRITDLAAELDKPLEALDWKRLEDQIRLSGLLAHFGQLDRGIRLAYKLFLSHRDTARAWLSLSSIVLDQGRNLQDKRWDMPAVANHAAIDMTYDDGESRLIIIEPDPELRKLDPDAYEPQHPLVQRLMGAIVGTAVQDDVGRTATVTTLRHKYIARFHVILDDFQKRFPTVAGFRRINIDASTPKGLEPLLNAAKARHDWIEDEQRHYLAGEWPIGLLAYRVGADPIEASAGVVAAGYKLQVATGNHADVQAAGQALIDGAGQGLTLDLAAFWTSWRLQALNALESAFGPIHVPQSVVDRLRTRRDQFDAAISDGIHGAQYQDGMLVMTHIAPDEVRSQRDDIVASLAWLEAHANVCPLIVSDTMPEHLKDEIRSGRSDLFDAIAIATSTGTILISDDLFTRHASGLLTGQQGAWTQMALRVAHEKGAVDFDTYLRWLADLIEGGHSYLGVTGEALAYSAAMDAKNGKVPGRILTLISSAIGGVNAEPRSHLAACMSCLSDWWNDPAAITYRQPATGHLLRQLVRGRKDYREILRTLVNACDRAPGIREYIFGWLRGHFLKV